MKILVVEDEKSLNAVIAKRLKIEHYSVDCAYDGLEAEEYLAVTEYDLLLVDIMLPQEDGLTLIKKLRAKGSTVPVIFLTARDTLEDKVQGLDTGADDYLVKPFEFAELLARIRSLLRRNYKQPSNELSLDTLTLNMQTHQVKRAQAEITLTAKEFALLEYLLQNTGTVLTRQQIQEHIWDFSYEGSSNMIDVYINSLRKKIDRAYDVKLVHTIRGVGYVLKI